MLYICASVCVGAICENRALCVDHLNGYTCNCADGYRGDTCELTIDECASSPCVNNGECLDSVASYTCSCEAGWEGDNCAVENHLCTADEAATCAGSCVDDCVSNGPGHFTCVPMSAEATGLCVISGLMAGSSGRRMLAEDAQVRNILEAKMEQTIEKMICPTCGMTRAVVETVGLDAARIEAWKAAMIANIQNGDRRRLNVDVAGMQSSYGTLSNEFSTFAGDLAAAGDGRLAATTKTFKFSGEESGSVGGIRVTAAFYLFLPPDLLQRALDDQRDGVEFDPDVSTAGALLTSYCRWNPNLCLPRLVMIERVRVRRAWTSRSR